MNLVIIWLLESKFEILFWLAAKVLFKDLNPGIAMAIVHFKFSCKLYFCFVSVIRQKFNFSAFSEMAQKFWFWLHWMIYNYDFVLVDDNVLKFKSIRNWNWKFLLDFLEIAIKVIHFMYRGSFGTAKNTLRGTLEEKPC